MLFKLIAEATECDFKENLELKKPKSWLKSVSAFANGIGGTLFFGVTDETKIAGLSNIQFCSEKISELINSRISPIPNIVLTPYEENGKAFLTLVVKPGRSTPYYYFADGQRQAYIRSGNESIPVPNHILNELILRGVNETYDSTPTQFNKNDYSFTLLEATYLQRTKLHFEIKDYESFGLVTDDNVLTRAGSLLADQYIVYNSRVFCTRWNGLEKGSVFDDALDDKEFKGNLIYLLQNSSDFIRNNSKVRFSKEATERIDKPDYAERAITEALVNALIHRDYLSMGSEVHIDMFNDRLEITSPGGMYGGANIQDLEIDRIKSDRRNPIIADLFHRMRYMERRGSGLKKIINETSKLPGYSDDFKPSFYSTQTSFTVILKNVNYSLDKMVQDRTQDRTQDGTQDGPNKVIHDRSRDITSELLEFCTQPKSKAEILKHFNYKSPKSFTRLYIAPQLENGKLQLTIPDKPTSKNQKYVSV